MTKTTNTPDIETLMIGIGQRARRASHVLALATDAQKRQALHVAAKQLLAQAGALQVANALDISMAQGSSSALRDRLFLDQPRIAAMASALDEIAELPDPVGRILARFERPNGLVIERVATPLGVIGVIYESRPNVTADAGALCLKAGNAAILRGGSESQHSSRLIHACLVEGLMAANLPPDAIALVPTSDRAAVGAMLKGLGGNIDVLVPRGGKSLVARVQQEALVPVFAHLEGIVHIYVDGAAELSAAIKIVLNAKMRRTGVCGAVETLLVDAACAPTHLQPLVQSLLAAGCAVRGDTVTQATDPRVCAATVADWSTEYLDAIISVRVVDGLDAAMAHIDAFGSHHTDAILTQDEAAAKRFLGEVESAIVLHNTSTQFADGGEFGFGGEIGIATGRMHARGPVGVEQLTSFNYRVHGTGQIRT